MNETLRVLILEDNPSDVDLIERELRKAGFRFTLRWAGDKAAYLEALQTFVPDLVLLDYALAGYDGMAALAAARRRFPDVPVILVSGAVGEETAIETLKAGATDYVLKQRLQRLGPVVRRGLSEAEHLAERRSAEEALRRSEQRLRRAQEIAHLGSWELDLVTNELTWSDEVYRIFGLQPQEFAATYEAFLERVHPEDRAQVDAAYSASVLEGRDSYEIEHRVVRKETGDVRHVQERCHHVRDADGRIVRSLGMVLDITERVSAEQAVRLAKEQWERTFDSVTDLIAILDPQHRVLRANRAMAARLGVRPEECVGLACYQVVHGTDVPPAFCPHVQTCLDGREYTVEVHEDLLGGDFLVTTTPLFDESRRRLGSVHVARDITASKQAEQNLQWSARRDELLSHTAARLLQSDDPQGLIEDLCGQVMEFLDCQAFFNFLADGRSGRLRLNASAGIPEEEAARIEWLDHGVAVCGCVARDQRRIIAEDIQNTSDPRTELVKSYGIQAYCCHPLMVQGRVIGTLWFGSRSRPRFRGDEVAVMEAVSSLVAIAMNRIEATAQIRASLAEKEVLLKEIHHRVKNNMQVISSLVDLQADELLDAAMSDTLRDVCHRVRSMALVHEQLYQSDDLSRVEFAGYVQSLLDYLWRAHGTAASNVRLVLDLQPLYLSVNTAVPCGLILNELASNALKHAFRGRTSGQVNVSLAGGEDGDVQLRIRDDGRGLPPGADWRQSRTLGLRLVQMLAGQLGGSVEVETGEDEGADFRIVFGHVGERNRGDREQGEPADR